MQSTTNQSSTRSFHSYDVHPKTHVPSVIQFALSVLGALCFMATATLTFSGVAFQFLNGGIRNSNLLPGVLITTALFFCQVLILIASVYPLARLAGWSYSTPKIFSNFSHPAYWLAILPIILVTGHWVLKNQITALIFLPVLHVLAISIPIYWLIIIATRNLPTLSNQRAWGSFTCGLVLSPLIIIIVEIFALLGLGIVMAVYLSSSPGLIDEIMALSHKMMVFQYDPELIIPLITPYLTHPVSIFALLGFGAVVVPLIEELIKPIGVWLLAGYRQTPQQGFIAGVLSGAGYALFESLALTSNVDEWSTVVIMRIGTAIIHITTTGLMGWALASAWHTNSYLQLGITYLLAVSIHGLWNFNTFMAMLSGLSMEYSAIQTSGFLTRFNIASPLSLIFIMIAAFFILTFSNKKCRL